ncbi:hypothetical protein J26TS2_17000 [Shouchella clausii]|uniref:hypothetical protein n=1 Tax=Shouchella tritolerans TaxID=2979466 RepID=UPI001B05E405|nr:hypothetical protein [Shouchella tritolerans]GIN11833.1 hypothetical protein J26TS2_17000 [Shouchella clausii]
MGESIIIALAIFCGWLILDFIKAKRITKEAAIQSAVVGLLGGLVWFIIGLFLPS